MFLIILVLLLTLTVADWTTPVKVIPAYKDSFSIFTDDSNGVSHVFWCNNIDLNFNYRRFYPNNTLSPIQVFEWEQPCNRSYVIKGAHDGKSLYLVFQGSRKRVIGGSCETDSNKCHDIFFSESINGGETWSKPKAVPRNDMADKRDRQYPDLIVTVEKRLWIFYRMQGLINSLLAHAMRTPGTSDFYNEYIHPIQVDTFSLKYAVNENTRTLSIFYMKQDDNDKFHYYTENNGISWRGPFNVTNSCDNDTIVKLPFSSDLSLPFAFFVCENEKPEKYLRIMVTPSTWTDVVLPKYTYTDHFTIPGDNNKKAVVAYCYNTVYYLPIDEKEFKKTIKPPTPNNEECKMITSSYKLKHFWYWYVTYNANNTMSLWSTSIPFDESILNHQ